jgi:hypothetical protein
MGFAKNLKHGKSQEMNTLLFEKFPVERGKNPYFFSVRDN